MQLERLNFFENKDLEVIHIYLLCKYHMKNFFTDDFIGFSVYKRVSTVYSLNSNSYSLPSVCFPPHLSQPIPLAPVVHTR